MLNTPEKPICLVERQHLLARKKIQLTKAAQRFERTRFLQERMARPMDKLKCLHDKLDFANATAAEFDVAFKLIVSDDVALDASLDVGDLVEQIGRRTLRINERLMLPQEFVSQLPIAADSARLDQGARSRRQSGVGLRILAAASAFHLSEESDARFARRDRQHQATHRARRRRTR